MSMQTLGPSDLQERRRSWRTRLTCGRPASPTSPGCLRRPAPSAPASGYEATSRESTATDPHLAKRCAGSSARFERSWQAVSTSSSQDTRQRPPIYSGLARPPVTSAGGAERTNDRHATTFSPGADGGSPRSEGCGRELRNTASGCPQGPLRPPPLQRRARSACGSRVSERHEGGEDSGLDLLGVQEESELEEIELVAQE